MKKLITTLFAFTIYLSSYSQSTSLDSLKNIWGNQNLEDTVRLKAIHKIIKEGYIFSQPDSAFYFAQEQYDFAEKKGLKKHMAEALNTQGISFAIRGQNDKAIKYYLESLSIREQTDDKEGVAGSLINIGIINLHQENYPPSLEYFFKAIKIMKELENKKGIGAVLLNIGSVYTKQDDYDNALKNYLASGEIYQEIQDKEGLSVAFNNIGSIYQDQPIPNDYENDIEFIADKYTKAIDYYNKSLKLSKELGDNLRMAVSLNNLGTAYIEQGKTKLKINDKNIYYNQALKYSNRALRLAQETGAIKQEAAAAKNLHEIYSFNNQPLESLKMYQLYISLRDSIEDIESKKKVLQQKFKYEYEKKVMADSIVFTKQREVDAIAYQSQLDKEANQRYAIIAGFVFLLTLIGVYLRIRFITNESEKKEFLKEIELLKVDLVLKMSTESNTVLKHVELNKEKIETSIDATLNKTDWSILTSIYTNPTATNSEIAEQVFLSLAGVRSSLSKMYRLFDLQSKEKNQRMSLIVEAIKISGE